MHHLKEFFLLDPTVVYLNHGSYGATPRPVFEVYQNWQRRMERQPVAFLGGEITGHLLHARRVLGDYLNVERDELVFVPNATFGVNVVAHSLSLGAGDEVLATDHEYGSCENVWKFLSLKTGFRYIRQPIRLPVSSVAGIVDQFWQGVTPRTRVIYLSHITSPTALCLPVAEICARARAAGILTVVDGAHALGQIPLDLAALGADFYTGNAHKWLSSPKGSAFLYARRDKQSLIQPLVVGWGWKEGAEGATGSPFIDYLQWLGTNDFSAYLSVPAAIAFQAEHDWLAVRQACHELATQAVHRICNLTGLPSIYPQDAGFYHQMAVAPLPPNIDLGRLKAALIDQYRVEIPCISWQGRQFIRISVQGYNTQEDIDALLLALQALL
ncbi:MAG: aminotransferase class V-fold PLP-dependent enzyme [Chloroflexi bacterium]|nr:aminotransferase class V-fold PLP-dependent enzyme [Chloroflexota bacterium]